MRSAWQSRNYRTGKPAEPESDSRPEAFESLRLALTGYPAAGAVLGAVSSVVDDELSRLSDEHGRVWPLVHASRYNELAPIVADLIPRDRQVAASVRFITI